MTYGIAHTPLLATVQANRRAGADNVAMLGGQLCFFERGTPVPAVGETVEIMIVRPIHPRGTKFGADYIDFDRLTGLEIRVVDRTKHQLVAIEGFECSGSMCSTTSFGAVTDGSRTLVRSDVMRGIGRDCRHLRDNFTITPGRSRISVADNVNPKQGEAWKQGVPTNVWVDIDPRTGLAQRQPRGGCVRVAGLTRTEDLECSSLVRQPRLANAA
jgi:hypothetical protein